MNRTGEAGVTFIQSLLTDVEVLTQRVDSLQAGLGEERQMRHDSLNNVLKSFSDLEQFFAERSDESATSLAKLTASLGAHSLQLDDLAANFQGQTEDLGVRFADLEKDCQGRLTQLEDAVAQSNKDTLADLGQLRSSMVYSADVATGLGKLQEETSILSRDVDKMASAADLSQIQGKVECLQSFMEAQVKFVNDEIGRKASVVELQSLRESTGDISSDIKLNHKLLKELEAAISSLPNSIQMLTTSFKALDHRQDTIDRRQEAGNERTNSCFVALQKELGTRISKDDLDPLAIRLCKFEEKSRGVHESQGLISRIEALETSLGAKADSKSFEKARLAISNQVSRHDELESRIDNNFTSLSSKFHSFAVKAEVEELVAKDDLGQQLLQFYSKAEVDALLARIWWRLNQSGKVVGLSGLTGKSQRPQSARR
jgi:hypothetical protein